MNEIHKGFKTLKEAEEFRAAISGNYEIIGLYDGEFPGTVFAYFLRETQND
jgi:hypothetical protein